MWDEEPSFELPLSYLVPDVRVEETKLIVIDCTTLIDQNGPLQDALTAIFSSSTYPCHAKEFMHFYMEYGTLRHAQGFPEDRSALVQDVARHLQTDIQAEHVEAVFE